MQTVREKILDNTDYFSRLISNIEEHGFEIYGDNYKKDRFPDLGASNVKKLLNKKNFYIGKRVKLNNNVFSAELADEIANGFCCIAEMYNFLKV